LIGLPSYLVMRDRCGSLLAFARDDVAWRPNPYPPHYRAAFASSDLLARNPVGSPYGLLSLAGGLRVYHVPGSCQDGLGSASSPVAVSSTTGTEMIPVPGHVPFGPSLSASLACTTWRRLPAVRIC